MKYITFEPLEKKEQEKLEEPPFLKQARHFDLMFCISTVIFFSLQVFNLLNLLSSKDFSVMKGIGDLLPFLLYLFCSIAFAFLLYLWIGKYQEDKKILEKIKELKYKLKNALDV
jgi:hypothetical protein